MEAKKFHYIVIAILIVSYPGLSVARAHLQNQNQVEPTIQQQALAYSKAHNLSTNYCVLIDMSIHSGKNRFFVWNFNRNKPIISCLVSHGCCDSPWSGDYSKSSPQFSNNHGSHCSSLGRYKIGERGWSNWGIHVNYILHGLDKSNSNAKDRLIVLHSWENVSDTIVYLKEHLKAGDAPLFQLQHAKDRFASTN